jgi:hypothetical protein
MVMGMRNRLTVLIGLTAIFVGVLYAQDSREDRKARRERERQAKREKEQTWKEAQKEFSKGIRSRDEASRVAAISTLASLKDERVIDAIAPYCSKDTVTVRRTAITALSGIDHPKSVKVLAGALKSNEKDDGLMRALIAGLKKLDQEAGSYALIPYLKRYQDPKITPLCKDILDAIGSMGSPDAIDKIIPVLAAAELQGTGGYNPATGGQNPGLGSTGGAGMANRAVAALDSPCKKALGAITGRPPSGSSTEWTDWWKKNKRTWFQWIKYVRWCPDTWERWEQGPRETKKKCPNNPKHGQRDPIIKRDGTRK